jgi:OFA family oxalate/formate antiporter-like MFS transporter
LTGVFISSFITSFDLFIVFFGVFFGLGTGLGYTSPILSAWSYFPDHKGRISGLIVCGFGFGAAIFN